MRKLFTLIFCCLSLVSNAQGELNFVKTIPTVGTQYSISSNDYQLELIPTSSKYIKLEVSVYSNTSTHILKQLFKVGRYNIVIRDGNIEFDRIKTQVFIKGNKLIEDIVLKIHAPLGVEILFNVNELIN